MERVMQATPLFAISDAGFMRQYRSGVWWAMYGDEQAQGTYKDTYLVGNLKKDVVNGHCNFDSTGYRAHIGFYFGMLHGGILSPTTGLLRPEATTLILLTHRDSKSGYNVGRRAFFTELEPKDTHYTEQRVIERLRDLVEDNREIFFQEDDHLIYWCLGGLAGMLSGQVFPMTKEEAHRWEREREWWQKRLAAERRSREPESAGRNTEPLTTSNILQEA
jgi:hypothetical protein